MQKKEITEEQKLKILEYAPYLQVKDICEDINVSVRSFYRLLQFDEEFAKKYREAKGNTKLTAAKAYFALINVGNEKACRFFMSSRGINLSNLELTADSFKDLDEVKRVILAELTYQDLTIDQTLKLLSIISNAELLDETNNNINALRLLLNTEDKLKNKAKEIDNAIGTIDNSE